MPESTTDVTAASNSGEGYHRILANVALYLMTGSASLAGTFTFQKEHRSGTIQYGAIEEYRSAALTNVDALVVEELCEFLRTDQMLKGRLIHDSDIRSVAEELVQKEIIEEKLEGTTYYLKARLLADPEQIS